MSKELQLAWLGLGAWRPAGSIHGDGLEVLENLLPEYGSLRSIQAILPGASFTYGSPITERIQGAVSGVHSHAFPVDQNPQEDGWLEPNVTNLLPDQAVLFLPPRGQAEYEDFLWLSEKAATLESHLTVIPQPTTATFNQHHIPFEDVGFKDPSAGDWVISYAIRVRGETSSIPEDTNYPWRVFAGLSVSGGTAFVGDVDIETGTGSSEGWIEGEVVTAGNGAEIISTLVMKIGFHFAPADLHPVFRPLGWYPLSSSESSVPGLILAGLGDFVINGGRANTAAVLRSAEVVYLSPPFDYLPDMNATSGVYYEANDSHYLSSNPVPPSSTLQKISFRMAQNFQDVDYLAQNSVRNIEYAVNADAALVGLALYPAPDPLSLQVRLRANQSGSGLRVRATASGASAASMDLYPAALDAWEDFEVDVSSLALDDAVLKAGIEVSVQPIRTALSPTSLESVYPSAGRDFADLDADPSSYVVYGVGSEVTEYTVPIAALVDPVSSSSGYTLVLEVKDEVSSSFSINLIFKQGATTIRSATRGWNSLSSATIRETLTQGEGGLIDWSQDLTVRIEHVHGEAAIQEMYFEYPTPAIVDVSHAFIHDGGATPANCLDIARLNLSVPYPAADQETLADLEHIYVGNESHLFALERGAWSEVVDGAAYPSGYNTGSVRGSEWNFCSFGTDLVVATNYVDPIQVRTSNTGDFGDLITAPSPAPKARFAVMVRGRLVLANINLTGHYADELWWSAYEDITDFDLATAAITRVDTQRLYDGVGEITGIVGGHYATIFQRRHMHLLSWVGGSGVFRLDPLSKGIGTPYGRSVVQANGALYFWDGATFRRWDGPGSPPVPIGTLEVSRFLLYGAAAHGNGAYRLRRAPAGYRKEATRLQGAYDASSGIIGWLYQGRDDEDLRFNKLLLYNTLEDRWGFVIDPSIDASAIVSRANPEPLTGRSMRGIALIQSTLSGSSIAGFNLSRFADSATSSARFRTKIRQIVENENVVINSVRPVFSADPGAVWPKVTVTVTASNDPRMQIGPDPITASTDDANEKQEIPIGLGGRWFVFDATIEALDSEVIESFDGFYIEYRGAGRE